MCILLHMPKMVNLPSEPLPDAGMAPAVSASLTETPVRCGLEKAAMYLTKADHYIAMVAPELGKVFGKGAMPEKRSVRGLPRDAANCEAE
jgi:hypothetical protein